MKVYKTKDLKPGMKFTMPVFMEGDNILVPAEVPLKQRDIDRLCRWDIGEVTTDGELLGGSQEEIPLWGFPSDGEVSRIYREIVSDTKTLLDSIRSSEKVSVDTVDSIAGRLVQEMEQRPFEMKRMVLSELKNFDSDAVSAVNCAIIAIGISHHMNRARPKHVQLATGALLHDVGMFRVSADIIQKKGVLSDAERQQIKTHPLHTYSILTKEMGYPEDIALMGLQHHERWDGMGYPRMIKGEGISVDARILSVADAFEAMVQERPYRNSIIGYQAIRNIINDNSSRFDPEIIKIFIKSMGLYPVGSIIILSDGSIARVIYTNPQAPLRPRIILIISKDGEEFRNDSGPVIDLTEESNLFVVKAVDLRTVLEKTRDALM